jgi:hypothetical protein
VAAFIQQNFLPVKIPVKEQPATFRRFGVLWTPTLLAMDAESHERLHFVGYMPAEDFLAHLELGAANASFGRKQWDEAGRRYRALAEGHPASELAPEAWYWEAVTHYMARKDHVPLETLASRLKHRYPDSIWTKKAAPYLRPGTGR